MSLAPGTRLGAYEIGALLGAGGMGEVYRARDTKLNREVALKVLPEAFTRDPDRLARFKREAQVLASLNHSHIGAIYGFEDSGGTHALVLELVEGDTLADRIARGRIPLDEALPIACQICEALEAAHEHGVVHRDLKPANIKVTADGTVKVLDFGLAKLVEPGGDGPPAAHSAPLSMSPTITSPAMMTGVGRILGTAAYMSPEQAKGREADKRSDIWAFGCVLYEMLTGKRPFDGEDVSDTLANVLKIDPDWSALPSETPLPICVLLQSCLTKDRRRRVADISTALFVLDKGASLAPPGGMASAPTLRRRPLWRRIAAVTVGALVTAAVSATLTWFVTRPAPPSVARMMITTSGTSALALRGGFRDIAITPDGSQVVYRGNNQLLARALNKLEPTLLSGLDDFRGLFVSPDGGWVGFFDATMLKKIRISGGPAVPLCAVQNTPRGATWNEEKTIIFATNAIGTGLERVSSDGGEPAVLTKPDREHGEGDHIWPEFLPGGDAVLYTITPISGVVADAQIAVLDLQTGTSKVLIRGGSHAHFVPTGHLVYGVLGTLHAVAFDLKRLAVVGSAVPVLDGVVTKASGAADIAMAGNGSLAYIQGGAGGAAQQSVVSVDRDGRPSPLPGLPLDSYRDVRVSPDGGRIALATYADVSVYDVKRANLSRLTTDPAPDYGPLWTTNGQRIIFTSKRAGYPELFSRPADGSGREERLLARGKDLADLLAMGWSGDGKQLLFNEVPADIRIAIGQIAIERPSDAIMLVKNALVNGFPAVSPNGRWIAYQSSVVTGRPDIYVERYPELGDRKKISSGGGRLPLWSRDGQELFFASLDGQQMFAVAMPSETTALVPGQPRVLFTLAMLTQGAGNRPYDIAPDGRFVIIRSGQDQDDGGTALNMIVVLNWFEELKRLVPVN